MRAKEIMKIKDPREAWKVIMTSKDLGLMEMMQMAEDYAKLHNVTTDEMAFYPNGERVLNPEMF